MRLPYIIEIHANPGFPQSNSSNRKSVHPIVPPIRIRFCLHEGFAPSSHLHNLVCGHFGSCADREWDLCRHETAPAIAKPKFGSAIRIRQSGRSSVFEVQFIYGINVQRSSKYILFHTTYIGYNVRILAHFGFSGLT